MADREKVMRGLEVCASSGLLCPARECPYSGYALTCKYQLMRDALALLKEQEPRLMTWEEVDKSGNLYVWTEIHSFYLDRGCLIYCTVVRSEFFDELFRLREDSGLKWIRTEKDYNRNNYRGAHSGWRCWTARPTEEQMRDTKWEEDKNDDSN